MPEKILKKHPKLDAVFGVSDEMALGALDTIIKKNLNGDVFVVGLDGNYNAMKSIKEGNLTATLNTNPIEMGRILMRTILRSKIKGEKIEGKTYVPITMVDLANVSQFL